MTRVFGVMGCPISHSLSPVMHTAAFRALGLDAVYAPFEVPPHQLSRVLRGLCAAGIEGLNITVPLKERIVAWLGRQNLERSAAAVGAVNTLVRKGERFVGYNTDVTGFRRALTESLRMDAQATRVLLLGAGGAARAVAWALATMQPQMICVANRTTVNATRLVRWLRACASGVTVETIPFRRHAIAEALREVDLLINATSLGLRASDSLPVDPAAFHRRLKVCDLVYRAPTTGLVREARRRGLVAIDGLPMLLYQGAESFRLWWHREPPISVMRRAVEEAVRKTSQ